MYKPVLVGICSPFGAVDGVGLVEDVSHMVADGSEADEQFLSNLPVGLASGN